VPDEFEWIPDWGAQGNTKADIAKIQFGDGYVQRQTKGMNPLQVTWNLKFDPRDDDEADEIEEFLVERQGVVAFTWTAPGRAQEKWTCDAWSRTKAALDVNAITATFTLVYEP
jgi:phage-related protein